MRLRILIRVAILACSVLIIAACTDDSDSIDAPPTADSAEQAGQRPAATQAQPSLGAPSGTGATTGGQGGAMAADLLPTPVVVPDALRSGAFAQDRQLQLPQGFAIAVIARVPGARSLEMAPWGELLVTRPGQGEIVALRPGADGSEAGQRILARGLQCPYGMVVRDGGLYVAQSTRIERFPVSDDGALGAAETVVSGLPPSPCGPHHYRPLTIDGGGNLYTAFGSSCNVCVEEDPRRGTVWRYTPDGQGAEYARGLRNVVDLDFHPDTGQLWVATNERDQLGDDVPPEPVGPIQEGADYGWPFCYWDGNGWVVDTRVPASNPNCQGLTAYNGLQAHTAPLGLEFYTRDQFPPAFTGSAFAGLHGSWNRTEGVGFKVVHIPVVDGQPLPAQDFVTGWLTGPRGPTDAWGRPVDVAVGPDGALYISDDGAGAVYRVSYTGG